MIEIEPFEGGSGKARLLASLRGEKVDRVPNFEILIEDQHVERLLGRPAGNTLGVGGDPAKGSEAAEGVRPMHAKDYIELCRIIGQDAIAMECLWTPIKRARADGTLELINDRSIKGRDDLDRIVWPGDAEMEERLQYIREYVAAAEGTGIAVVLLGGCIFQTLYEFVMGLEDCMVLVVEDRELLGELMSKSADYYAELFRRAVDAGIDILYPADDFAYNKGLFVRPDVFEGIWRPHFEKILAPVREAGVPIWFHSDGRLDDAMEMLIDMGVDCVTPMDPSGIDYRDYKKRYGHRVALW